MLIQTIGIHCKPYQTRRLSRLQRGSSLMPFCHESLRRQAQETSGDRQQLSVTHCAAVKNSTKAPSGAISTVMGFFRMT